MTAPKGQRGFTLLELLIAMTLLGLIVTMAFSGLRLGTRAWEAADARDHDVYLVQQMLRTRLGAAYLSPEFGPTRPGEGGEKCRIGHGSPKRNTGCGRSCQAPGRWWRTTPGAGWPTPWQRSRPGRRTCRGR